MRFFDPATWFQVSGKFRLVCRLPEGLTGKQALAAAAKHTDVQKWVDGMGEEHAGDHYLRCYAAHEELNEVEWRAFKKTGGSTYLMAGRA